MLSSCSEAPPSEPNDAESCIDPNSKDSYEIGVRLFVVRTEYVSSNEWSYQIQAVSIANR